MLMLSSYGAFLFLLIVWAAFALLGIVFPPDGTSVLAQIIRGAPGLLILLQGLFFLFGSSSRAFRQRLMSPDARQSEALRGGSLLIASALLYILLIN
jgi:hypothetical protein